ncbi:MAG: serine hydroxymethyltransferase [Candidatus Komeilibacteria bacterium]|nr:serine hydroxymethyltransferase [Candidatus Komeilibacteria bacterium]
MLDTLKQQDLTAWEIAQAELSRQRNGLEMIASENFVSLAVLEAASTVLTNKYAEGYPGKRYYGGNQFIDQAENLAIARAAQLFGAEHTNVQPHSGSQANQAAYLATLNPGDTVLGMSLACGGHLTHGHPISSSGKIYHFIHYGVSKESEQIDFDEVKALAKEHKPKVIVAGASAYPRQIDFVKFKAISDEVGAYLMVDMAHIAGLVAAKLHPDPIPVADIVTTTTHKTLRGPRGAMIFCKTQDRLHLEDKKNLAQKIDSAVFPGIQGGPLEHIILAKAVALQEALQPSFAAYQQQIITNAKILETIFLQNGLRLISGGTDNHLLLVDVTAVNLSGKEAENLLASCEIYVNKNAIPFDTRSPMDPSGIRLGTAALTTRGLKETEIKLVGEWFCQILKNPTDAAKHDQIKKEIAGLLEQFPLYPQINS